LEGRRWQSCLQSIRWAVKAPQPNLIGENPIQLGFAKRDAYNDSSSDRAKSQGFRNVLNTAASHTNAQYHSLCEHIGHVSPAALKEAARAYLTRALMQRLAKFKPVFEFEDDGPRLYVHCEDNLLLSFYWMLASDLQGKRLPAICAVCRRFFKTTKVDAVYCPNPKCRETGRKRRSREKHGAKWNRNKRLKRHSESR